jgi:hypothetical protein
VLGRFELCSSWLEVAGLEGIGVPEYLELRSLRSSVADSGDDRGVHTNIGTDGVGGSRSYTRTSGLSVAILTLFFGRKGDGGGSLFHGRGWDGWGGWAFRRGLGLIRPVRLLGKPCLIGDGRHWSGWKVLPQRV